MLPPAPKQTYIDCYLDTEGDDVSGEEQKKVEGGKRRQADYETEVEMYRCLERLEEQDIVVLHNFEYTHHQYRLCVASHVRKGCKECKNAANREAECDFLILGGRYVVIMEVKNVLYDGTEEKKRELEGAIKKSRKQREKVKDLIERLMKQVLGEECAKKCQILTFSAFPNTQRFILQDTEDKQILCREDLVDFGRWWQENVTDSISGGTSVIAGFEGVKEILLAIWCTDKNQCDELKCSLGKCIKEIDEELRRGRITYLSKNQPLNPNVINVLDIAAANLSDGTNIFRDFLKIEHVTAEQYEAFSSDRDLLLINGPSGSGKTIILLAKIIELIKSSENNRVVLIIYKGNKDSESKEYQDPLKEAGLIYIYKVMEVEKLKFPLNLESTVRDILLDFQLVLVQLPIQEFPFSDCVISGLMMRTKNVHVFLDDFQAGKNHHDHETKLQRKFFDKSSLVWLTCDLTQMHVSNKYKMGDLSNFILEFPVCVTLFLNLRNTWDIAHSLSTIRRRLSQEVKSGDPNIVFPMLKPGHYIHGPRTVIYLVDDCLVVFDILNKELDKLCKIGVSCVVVVDSSFPSKYNFATVASRASDDTIDVIDVKDCYSAEYPAAIVILDARVEETGIAPLYLMMSRARVYCSVILIRSNIRSVNEVIGLNDLLKELKDSVRIIKYS